MLLGPGEEVIEDFQSSEDTSDGKTGETSLNTGRMRGGGGEGLGGKKSCRSVWVNSVGEKEFSSPGKRSRARPTAIFLASHTDHKSILARNWD